MQNVIQNGDQANGHTDVLGNSIIGTITSSHKMKVLWVSVSRDGDIVTFPSHPHALDWYGSPINYRSHSVPVSWTAKIKVLGLNCAMNGDIVPVWDEAGPNATMQATQFKFKSN